MNLVVFGGAILCGWMMLLTLSGERALRVRKIRAEIRATSEQAARAQAEAEKPIIVG
jgi:hypothetical protein